MRWPQWIHEALRLGPAEVSRVRPGLPEADRKRLRDASEQPDEAVELLLRRLQRTTIPTRRQRVPLWMPIAAASALAALAWVSLNGLAEPEYGEITLQTGVQAQLLQADVTQLGPSIAMRGLATVQVVQADEHGTVVRIERGSAHFEVDPGGPFRELTVLADDTRVRVTGTSFIVHRLWDSVHVDVLRGSVLIDRAGALETVVAGESWSHQGVVATALPTQPTWVVADTEPLIDADDSQAVPPLSGVVPGPTDTVRQADTAPSPPIVAPTAPQSAEAAYAAVLDAVDAEETPASIARAVDAFLRRFPDSPLAPDATALRLEIATDLEAPAVVLDDVIAWLDAWPGHPRRLAMLELGATVARDRLRDCARALPLYRELSERVGVSKAPSMLALRGLCALDVGEREEAQEALTRATEGPLDPGLSADVVQALSRLDEASR